MYSSTKKGEEVNKEVEEVNHKDIKFLSQSETTYCLPVALSHSELFTAPPQAQARPRADQS